jgi:hypothetical protein
LSNEDVAPGGAEPSAVTDWQAEYCRIHAELQGAYAEISALQGKAEADAKHIEWLQDRLRYLSDQEGEGDDE